MKRKCKPKNPDELQWIEIYNENLTIINCMHTQTHTNLWFNTRVSNKIKWHVIYSLWRLSMGQFSRKKKATKEYESPSWNGKYCGLLPKPIRWINWHTAFRHIHIDIHDCWTSGIEMVCAWYLSAEVFGTTLEWSCELFFIFIYY